MDFTKARAALAAGDVELACAELKALYPTDPEFLRLEEYVRFAVGVAPQPRDVSIATGALLDSIARVAPGARSTSRRAVHHIPRDLDFIADLSGVDGWSAVHALNRLVLDQLRPLQRAAVVGTMRDDGIYILEFVAHYLALGFDHVFIYTNDNSDASDALLSLLAQHGVVTLLESEVTGEVPPEAKAFGHAMNLLGELRDYEWALFVDSDEFLVPAPRYDYSVERVLMAVDEAHPDGRVAGILYDWLWFVSDMVFERGPGLLCERFQHARPHWLAKCLVRVKDVQSMRRQHHPEVAPGYLVVDSLFRPLDIATIWERHLAEYGGGRLNHYWPRSFEEFAVKKARGAALGGTNNLYDRPYKTFFTWNGHATAENSYPTDPRMVQLVKQRIGELRALQGVASVADGIERDFPSLVRRIADEARLRADYAASKAEPGDL